MIDQPITVTISREDAEVLIGVLATERHNARADAACDALRREIDAKLRELGY